MWLIYMWFTLLHFLAPVEISISLSQRRILCSVLSAFQKNLTAFNRMIPKKSVTIKPIPLKLKIHRNLEDYWLENRLHTKKTQTNSIFT